MANPFGIAGKKFSKSLRGYNGAEVDAFLEKIQKYHDDIYEESARLKEELDDCQNKLGQYQQLEETMQSALALAQTAADEIKESALLDKNSLLREAEEKARQIVEGAQVHADEVVAERERQIEQKQSELETAIKEAKDEYDAVKNKTKDLIEKTRSFLVKELKVWSGDEVTGEAKEPEEMPESQIMPPQGEEAQEEEAFEEIKKPAPTEPTGDMEVLEWVTTAKAVEEQPVDNDMEELKRRAEEIKKQSREIREQLKSKGKSY